MNFQTTHPKRESERELKHTSPEVIPKHTIAVRLSSSSLPRDDEYSVPLPSFLFLLKPILFKPILVGSPFHLCRAMPKPVWASHHTHCSNSTQFEHPATPILEISSNPFLKPTTPYVSHFDKPTTLMNPFLKPTIVATKARRQRQTQIGALTWFQPFSIYLSLSLNLSLFLPTLLCLTEFESLMVLFWFLFL